MSLTTDAAASAPLVYVTATLAPSSASRLAIAAPMPRDPPVTSAVLPCSFLDIVFSCPFNSFLVDPEYSMQNLDIRIRKQDCRSITLQSVPDGARPMKVFISMVLVAGLACAQRSESITGEGWVPGADSSVCEKPPCYLQARVPKEG